MKDDILKYLRTVTAATAKAIADRIGVDRLDVARELNALHADGIVEREKRNGNEYAYWLTVADSISTLVPAAAPAARISLPAAGESVNAGTVALELQVAMLTEEVTDLKGKLDATTSDRITVNAANDALKAENESLRRAADDWKRNCTQLEQRIDELTVGPVGAKPLFVTVGRYCKPQRHDSLDAAQKRASKLIRAEKESAILICEPLGQVIRGAQWQPRAAAPAAQVSPNTRGAQ